MKQSPRKENLFNFDIGLLSQEPFIDKVILTVQMKNFFVEEIFDVIV